MEVVQLSFVPVGGGAEAVRYALEQEVAQVSQAMEDEIAGARTRGRVLLLSNGWPVAADCCASAIVDNAFAAAQLYIRPLIVTRDEHDRFVIALLSEEISR